MKIKHPIGRVLPPEFKFTIDQPFTMRFTWKQRFLIALGCPVVGRFICWCTHNPIKVHPLLEITTDPKSKTNTITHPELSTKK